MPVFRPFPPIPPRKAPDLSPVFELAAVANAGLGSGYSANFVSGGAKIGRAVLGAVVAIGFAAGAPTKTTAGVSNHGVGSSYSASDAYAAATVGRKAAGDAYSAGEASGAGKSARQSAGAAGSASYAAGTAAKSRPNNGVGSSYSVSQVSAAAATARKGASAAGSASQAAGASATARHAVGSAYSAGRSSGAASEAFNAYAATGSGRSVSFASGSAAETFNSFAAKASSGSASYASAITPYVQAETWPVGLGTGAIGARWVRPVNKSLSYLGLGSSYSVSYAAGRPHDSGIAGSAYSSAGASATALLTRHAAGRSGSVGEGTGAGTLARAASGASGAVAGASATGKAPHSPIGASSSVGSASVAGKATRAGAASSGSASSAAGQAIRSTPGSGKLSAGSASRASGAATLARRAAAASGSVGSALGAATRTSPASDQATGASGAVGYTDGAAAASRKVVGASGAASRASGAAAVGRHAQGASYAADGASGRASETFNAFAATGSAWSASFGSAVTPYLADESWPGGLGTQVLGGRWIKPVNTALAYLGLGSSYSASRASGAAHSSGNHGVLASYSVTYAAGVATVAFVNAPGTAAAYSVSRGSAAANAARTASGRSGSVGFASVSTAKAAPSLETWPTGLGTNVLGGEWVKPTSGALHYSAAAASSSAGFASATGHTSNNKASGYAYGVGFASAAAHPSNNKAVGSSYSVGFAGAKATYTSAAFYDSWPTALGSNPIGARWLLPTAASGPRTYGAQGSAYSVSYSSAFTGQLILGQLETFPLGLGVAPLGSKWIPASGTSAGGGGTGGGGGLIGTTIFKNAGRRRVNEASPDERQHRRELAQALNSVISGQISCTMQVTLTPNATTTLVFDPRISIQTHADFSPTTATAAAELASGGMYWVCSGGLPGISGTITVTHRNEPTTDRTFTVAILG